VHKFVVYAPPPVKFLGGVESSSFYRLVLAPRKKTIPVLYLYFGILYESFLNSRKNPAGVVGGKPITKHTSLKAQTTSISWCWDVRICLLTYVAFFLFGIDLASTPQSNETTQIGIAP